MTERQRTVAAAGALSGPGLHTGAPATLRVRPAAAGTGLRFVRTDLEDAPSVTASVDRVVSTDRGTVIQDGRAVVHTVEHFLAAAHGLGVDNLQVEIDGPELPVLDGSARGFVKLLDAAGRVTQEPGARLLAPSEPFELQVGDSRYRVDPAESLRVTAMVDFPHPLIGRQEGSWKVDAEVFRRELAPARTFGFVREVEALRSRGLALGGTVDNAVVLDDEGVVGGAALRFQDEFVRHKALDVVGDLALVGGRIHAHVSAERPSHRGNVALAREIWVRTAPTARTQRGVPMLSVQQIMEYLPHRYPFLLVDRVLDFEPGKRIVGLKNVTINEPFFNGHFPGNPIMPGVLIVEAMAQVGGLLVMDQMEDRENKIVLFMSLDNVRWRRPVVPGDQVRFEVEILKIRRNIARMKGVGRVDGQVVAEAEMMASVVDR